MNPRKNFKQTKSASSSSGVTYDILHFLAAFWDQTPDVIYFKDPKGKLILVNQAHAKGLGLSPQQVKGMTDFDIFPRAKAVQMAKDDAHVIKTGKPIIDKIERATRPDGEDNYVSTTKIPLRDRFGKIIGLAGITRDITRRAQFEQQKEQKIHAQQKLASLEDLEKLKSEFISTVSHELRTPLAITKQLVGLLDSAVSVSSRKQIMQKMTHNLDRLQTTFDKLLDLSRIENKRLKLQYTLINLNELIRESQDYFRQLAAEKNIQCVYHLPKHDVNLFIDADRVYQVILNLMTNAIKFTEENGRVTLEVRVLEQKVRVGVIDTGVGITKTDLTKIFDKFVQLASDESARRKGIGLGLTIVKEIVEQHGGEIWVESSPGVGSKFYFTLPRYYTARRLPKDVRDRINGLFAQNVPVSLMHLLILNYTDFIRRFNRHSRQLAEDLRRIIIVAFDEVFRKPSLKDQLFVTDLTRGRLSVILPQSQPQQMATFSRLVRERARAYFCQNKASNVFIAMGMISYPTKTLRQKTAEDLPYQEIYIGAELRKSRRLPYDIGIQIHPAGEAPWTAKAVDVSACGLCVDSSKLLITDQTVTLNWTLSKVAAAVSLQARVAWISPQAVPAVNKYKIGLEFVQLKGQNRKHLNMELRRINKSHRS